MHISLTPELEASVKAKVESGLYNNASEVVREALRFMAMHEDWVAELKLDHLRRQINEGLSELDNGRGTKINSRNQLDQLFDSAKSEA